METKELAEEVNEMSKKEAAGIIDSMTESLRNNPNQFQIQINVAGQFISNAGPGTGVEIHVSGGGPGSNTTGQKVSMDSSQIEITQKAGDEAMKQEMKTLVESLGVISHELTCQKPDKQKISKVCQSLKTWVPSLIRSVLVCVLTQAVGMAW